MEIKRFLGIKNTTSTERLKPGELTVASDVDIDNTGRALSREGITKIDATSSHSLYSNPYITLFVQGASLKRINSNLTFTTLATLTSASPMSYAEYGGVTYYSNGVDKGRIVNGAAKQWGITPPVGQPVAAAADGALPPGRYLYALTFVRSDGYESGTGLAGVIEIPAGGGGISFSSIEVSTNPEVSGRILYLTSPNGEALYRAIYLDNVAKTAVYTGDATGLSVALDTQFAGPPPAGDIVRVYNGIAYVITGGVAYYSDPYNLELFRMDKNFLQFPSNVGMFECVNDGLYVGTEDTPEVETGAIWYLSGERADKMKSTQLYNYGVIPGTAVKTEASHFMPPDPEAPEWSRPAVVWGTRHGICIGYDSGQCQNLTEQRYSLPVAQRGAGLVRQTRGYVQYIAVLQGAGAANNIAP